MKMIGRMTLKLAVAATALSALGTPALARNWHHDHDRGRYDHRDRYSDRNDVRLRGPGVNDLNPWFRNAKAGREFAARRAGSHISERDAWMLNREFRHRDGDRWDDRRWR